MRNAGQFETYTTADGWIMFRPFDGRISIGPTLAGANLSPVDWGSAPEGLVTLGRQEGQADQPTASEYFVEEDVTPQKVVNAIARAIHKN
jgi:hypothetical protein